MMADRLPQNLLCLLPDLLGWTALDTARSLAREKEMGQKRKLMLYWLLMILNHPNIPSLTTVFLSTSHSWRNTRISLNAWLDPHCNDWSQMFGHSRWMCFDSALAEPVIPHDRYWVTDTFVLNINCIVPGAWCKLVLYVAVSAGRHGSLCLMWVLIV